LQVPVTVTIHPAAKEFSISVGTPPASSLILKEANIKKGSGNPVQDKVADLKIEQIIKISKMKEDSLLGKDLKEKVKEIIGTCQSMGILVEGVPAHDAVDRVNKGEFDQKIKDEKTELSTEELKELEVEKQKLAEEVEKRREEYTNTAKGIIAEMAGKEKSAIKGKLHEAKIPEQIIHELMPAEEEKKEGEEGDKKEAVKEEAPKKK